jgi:hypothetical protein
MLWPCTTFCSQNLRTYLVSSAFTTRQSPS